MFITWGSDWTRVSRITRTGFTMRISLMMRSRRKAFDSRVSILSPDISPSPPETVTKRSKAFQRSSTKDPGPYATRNSSTSKASSRKKIHVWTSMKSVNAWTGSAWSMSRKITLSDTHTAEKVWNVVDSAKARSATLKRYGGGEK